MDEGKLSMPLLTEYDKIEWALKVSKCRKCRPQCWTGQVLMWAFVEYEKKIAATKSWDDTVDELDGKKAKHKSV